MRQLDGKFRIDGEQIIHPNGTPIPEDEPLFFFRARDKFAIYVLYYYLATSQAFKCTQYHIDGIKEAIKRFEEFKNKYPNRMKEPGITEGK